MSKEKVALSQEEKKMLHKAFYYSWGTNMASSKVSMQSKCFAMAVKQGLDVFYKDDPEGERKAFYRHASEFFNTHQVFLGLLVGICLAMEKRNAEAIKKGEPDIGETISTMKASLMGPTAGIGDSFFFNCFRVIIAGLCIGLSSDGSPLGVILFILLYGCVLMVCKYQFLKAGYVYGTTLISDMYEKGIVPIITEAAGLLGAIMVGALIASNVTVTVALAPTIGGATVNFQEMLDNIMPGLLSLILWGWSFSRIQKGWSATKLIFVIMGGCIVLALFHIF
jgi:mannose/fructose/N-acetylgalactosamine-specific phosphotransferase system component IID